MERFMLTLGICSAVMSCISVLYIAMSRVLRNKWSAKRRYYLWIFLFIGFLTPFKPYFGKPMAEIVLPEQDVPLQELPVSDVSPIFFQIPVLLFFLWILGVMIFSVFCIYRQYQFKRYRNRLSRPCNSKIKHIAESIAEQMGIADVKTVMLAEIAAPMMTGFRTPVILLPERNYSDTELRFIIKHELIHFQRHDLVYKLLLLICRAVHWFNPLMLMIARVIEQECEFACDEAVIADEEASAKKGYCQSILSTVTMQNARNTSPVPVVATNFFNGKHNLKYRLKLIASSQKKRKYTFLCAMILLLTIFSGTVFSVAGSETSMDGSNAGIAVTTTMPADKYETQMSTTVTVPENMI